MHIYSYVDLSEITFNEHGTKEVVQLGFIQRINISLFFIYVSNAEEFLTLSIVVRNKISCEVYIINMFLLKTRSVLTYQIKYQVISIYCYYKTL